VQTATPEPGDGRRTGPSESSLIPRSQTLRSHRAYPVEEVREAELRDGRKVTIRPTRTGDAAPLQDLFFHLRPEDVRTRFFRQLRSLTDEMAQHLCGVSYEQEMAFVAVVGEPESERIVGSSAYFLDPGTGLADVSYMIDPEWQGVGLGCILQARAIEYARAHGVRGFTADVLSDNAAMLTVFRRSGCRLTSHVSDGVVEMKLLFEDPAVDPSGGQVGRQTVRPDAAPPVVKRRSMSRSRRSRSHARS